MDDFKNEVWELLIMVASEEISLAEAHDKICKLGVSISLLEKAYNLIPEGTSHNDLIALKKAIFKH